MLLDMCDTWRTFVGALMSEPRGDSSCEPIPEALLARDAIDAIEEESRLVMPFALLDFRKSRETRSAVLPWRERRKLSLRALYLVWESETNEMSATTSSSSSLL